MGSTPPTGHVTDRTVFSQRPHEKHLLEEMSLLEKSLPVREKLILKDKRRERVDCECRVGETLIYSNIH